MTSAPIVGNVNAQKTQKYLETTPFPAGWKSKNVVLKIACFDSKITIHLEYCDTDQWGGLTAKKVPGRNKTPKIENVC